jgi:hypothetical protein
LKRKTPPAMAGFLLYAARILLSRLALGHGAVARHAMISR